MTEIEKRMHRCCFTGHRHEKLTRGETYIKRALERQIKTAIDDGLYVFITGMARGVDLWAAQIVLKLRRNNSSIRLICACPFEGFENGWSSVWRDQYRKVLQEADLVRYICEGYNRYCFQKRNEWMVDHASRVIAVFNGESGGTKNTIDYARKCGVPVVTIDG